MSPTGFSVPAARISIMVNMAYLLGKGAISPEQYNIVSSFIEGTDTITSNTEPLILLREEAQHPQQSRQQDRLQQNRLLPSQMIDPKKDMLGLADPGAPVFEESKSGSEAAAKCDIKTWGAQNSTSSSATSPVVKNPRRQEQVTVSSEFIHENITSIPRPNPAQLDKNYKEPPFSASASSAASTTTAASAASPRTAQDIRNEFARKVMLAKTNGESANTACAPLQQVQNQSTSKQPEARKPSQQESRPGHQNLVHGNGVWNEKKAEDFQKRLVQIGVPTPTSRRPMQSSATPSSGVAGYASWVALTQSRNAAQQDLPVHTTGALESRVAEPSLTMQENQRPDSSLAKRPSSSGIVPPEAWSEW